jgi:glycosyltransferase involved in cell wall biosynthesis
LRVSAIIPTYNRREQLFRAIESVFMQTLPVAEVIVVDDGSTDGTAEAVEQRYGARIRFFRQTNAGVSAARNRGIQESRGDWIGLLDSDDWWHPEKLKRQFMAIESFGDTSGLCFTDNLYGGNPQMLFSRFEEVAFRDAPPMGVLDQTAWRILAGREPFFTSSFLIRRSVFDEIDGFDEMLTLREDTDVAFRLSFKTQFCFVREPLTEIDRTPSRSLGLCKLYGTRADVVFDCSERIYKKWLSMPEVVGSQYEAPLRELLEDMFYASAESKFREMRLRPALLSLLHVRDMGTGPVQIAATLAARKMRKMKRNWTHRFGPPTLNPTSQEFASLDRHQ